jgi:ArsR family transcriptional regulator
MFYMRKLTKTLRALSDGGRLRITLLLSGRELCVCQLMAVMGVSQPLASKNLAILKRAGLLESRRKGKLMFYRLGARIPPEQRKIIRCLTNSLADSPAHRADLRNLTGCTRFQKLTGLCGSAAFKEFMKSKKRKGVFA